MRSRLSLLLVVAVLLATGCATAGQAPAPRHATSADDPRELLAQNGDAVAERAQTERARRWAARKELCRNLNVRFDRSMRCW